MNTFLTYDQDAKRFVWTGGFETRMAPKLAGFRWDPTGKIWYTVSATQAAKLRDQADEAAKAALGEAAGRIEASAQVDADLEIPRPEGLEYLGYQRAGIAYASQRKRTIIADEMGLGKTIQAIGLANLTRPQTILVVCPASLKLNWAKELNRWLVYSPDVTVTNYERLKHFDSKVDLLIVDEAHYAKNPKAKRTAQVRRVADLADRVLFLTGTPFLNRPIEIFNLVNLCDKEQFSSWFYFATKYCAAKQTRYGIEFGTPTPEALEELQSRLRETCMVRRLKANVLTELPPKRRQIIELEPDGKTKGLVNLEKEFFDELGKIRPVGVEFEAVSALRSALGQAKVEHVLEHVREIWEEVPAKPLVIFTHHVAVAEKIHQALGGVIVTGEQSVEQRQEAVEAFQSGEANLFVGTIAAAGVGLTLTRSEHLVFVETDWVPANILQAEDRIHRIGQRASVLIQYLVFAESLDSKMLNTFAAKQSVIERGLNGSIGLPQAKVDPAFSKVPKVKVEAQAEVPKFSDEEKALILSMLRYLSARCDGALQEDGQGFNGVDSGFGKDLARREFLTDRQAAAARKMLRKYRGQLLGGGFTYYEKKETEE